MSSSHTGRELAECIDRFNAKLRPNHPPVKTFLKVQNMFHSQVVDVWAKRYRDEVIYMMEHWKNQAEAQQSFITNFERARQQCETIKSQVLSLQDQKLKYVEKKKPVPEQLLQELAEATTHYRKYEGLLDGMRASVQAQQKKLTGPVGQFLLFDTALTSFFELYIAFERELRAATESYYPFLSSTRRDQLLSSPTAGAYPGTPLGSGGTGAFTFDVTQTPRDRSWSIQNAPPSATLGPSANGLDEAALTRALNNLRGMATFLAETHAVQYDSLGSTTPSVAVKKSRELSMMLEQFQLDFDAASGGKALSEAGPDGLTEQPEGAEDGEAASTSTVRFVAARRRKSQAQEEDANTTESMVLRARHEAFLQATANLVIRNQDGSVAETVEQTDLAETASVTVSGSLGMNMADFDLKEIELKSWEFAAGHRRPLRDLLAALHLVVWGGAPWQPVSTRQIKATPDLFNVAQTAILMAAGAADIPLTLPAGELAVPPSDEEVYKTHRAATPQGQGVARRIAVALRTALQTEVDAEGGAFWMTYDFMDMQQREQQAQMREAERARRASLFTLANEAHGHTASPLAPSAASTPASVGSATTLSTSTGSSAASPTVGPVLAAMRSVLPQASKGQTSSPFSESRPEESSQSTLEGQVDSITDHEEGTNKPITVPLEGIPSVNMKSIPDAAELETIEDLP